MITYKLVSPTNNQSAVLAVKSLFWNDGRMVICTPLSKLFKVDLLGTKRPSSLEPITVGCVYIEWLNC